MRLMLAPMEGLADEVLRDVLTALAPYDQAVTEFIRVSAAVVPRRAFLRISPELRRGGMTPSGTPVQVQLLGSHPERMAMSAAMALPLSPAGIDLNFGCPAAIVNRNRGGAVLLDEPETLHEIASAVRRVMPRGGALLSAKMRLGVADKGRAVECAQALTSAGVERLVIHARTKAEGYRPPAHWQWVARVAEAVDVPVVANGEVWTVADWQRCRAESGVPDVMLGRGAVVDPFLARDIRSGVLHDPDDPRDADWAVIESSIGYFWARVRARTEPRHAPGRLKQWLNMLSRRFAQAERLFTQLRLLKTAAQIDAALLQLGITADCQAA